MTRREKGFSIKKLISIKYFSSTSVHDTEISICFYCIVNFEFDPFLKEQSRLNYSLFKSITFSVF